MIKPEVAYRLGRNTVLVNDKSIVRCVQRGAAYDVARECKATNPNDKVQILNINSMKMVTL